MLVPIKDGVGIRDVTVKKKINIVLTINLASLKWQVAVNEVRLINLVTFLLSTVD